MDTGVRRVLPANSKWLDRAALGIGACVALFLVGLPLAAQIAPVAAGPAIAVAEPACRIQGPIADWDAAAQLIAGISSASYSEAFSDEQKTAWTDYSRT